MKILQNKTLIAMLCADGDLPQSVLDVFNAL